MAITVKTNSPSSLLSSIKRAIDNQKITTWRYDSGGDSRHSPEQWDGQGYLKPSVGINELTLAFNSLNPKVSTKIVSAVYQGRFIEMLANHFESDYTSIEVVTP